MAVQALRNAPIAAAISHLQHAAATLPWSVRVAAVQGLAKVSHLLNGAQYWQCPSEYTYKAFLYLCCSTFP